MKNVLLVALMLAVFSIQGCRFYNSEREVCESRYRDSLRKEIIFNNNKSAALPLHRYYKSIGKEWEMIAYYIVLSEYYSDTTSNYAIYDIIVRDSILSHDNEWNNLALKYLGKYTALNDSNTTKVWGK